MFFYQLLIFFNQVFFQYSFSFGVLFSSPLLSLAMPEKNQQVKLTGEGEAEAEKIEPKGRIVVVAKGDTAVPHERPFLVLYCSIQKEIKYATSCFVIIIEMIIVIISRHRDINKNLKTEKSDEKFLLLITLFIIFYNKSLVCKMVGYGSFL